MLLLLLSVSLLLLCVTVGFAVLLLVAENSGFRVDGCGQRGVHASRCCQSDHARDHPL
eukprot:m.514570 g.514570  ORF g.514570 m.514570 type:complete len:58 (+) comp113530_c0_seq1:61-234(+)